MEEKANKIKEIVEVVTLLLFIALSSMLIFHASKKFFFILTFVYVANFLFTIEVIRLMSKLQVLKKNSTWIITKIFSNVLAFVLLALILFDKL